ncbi:MAG: AAA family ATPase [Candidatus Peribacteria bacterium]|jgi:molybdopterin-guanine dinucleotide biosynthesis protein|nr:AAA family ATPase [Candidatus Peribacteria bacterium]
MTKVIAFSGIHNTGKTTAINTLRDFLIQEGKLVMVLQESARLFHKFLHSDPMMLQSSVNKMELSRLDYLHSLKSQNIFDYIIVDRTPKDNIAYTKFLQQTGKLDPDFLSADTDVCPYDTIIFYTTPIHESLWSEEELLRDILLETI